MPTPLAARCLGLCLLLLLAPMTASGATAKATSRGSDEDRNLLRFSMRDPENKPIPKGRIKEFYCSDLEYEPIATKIVLKDGEAVVFLPDKPFQVTALLVVPGFGEIHVYADHNGEGYSRPGGRIDFVADAAETRVRRVRELIDRSKAEGLRIPPKVYERLQAGGHSDGYRLLAEALWAGEELTLAVARERIKRLPGPRKDFLFGCNAFGLGRRGPEYERRFKELFNYGTAHCYLTTYAPSPAVRDLSRTDREVAWLLAGGLEATICPPVYLARSVTPDWIRNLTYAENRQVFHELMHTAVKRYAGKVRFHEIVNEAHDFSVATAMSPAELTDLAAVCSKATRQADPSAQRIINCCHLWGEYAAHVYRDGRPRRSPMRYLKDCIAAGVEFEIVGLQTYYPDYDLLEFDRMLERYARLGKTIHITESACSSAPGVDPDAQRKKATAGWHGPWSEAIQADWVEAVYTIYYSKPFITAASWWDLADAVSFWPYGGLLRGDCSPKPAYLRLRQLQRDWGLRK